MEPNNRAEAEMLGFSFKSSIINKASDDQLSKLGRGWIWANKGTIDHLKTCIAEKGWAVTPGRWKDGWKNGSEGQFLGSSTAFLDFDGGVSLTTIVADPFIQESAAFIYTTASHGKKTGDRFRVVFQLDQQVHELDKFNKVIKGLKKLVPGSDDAITGVSCLFGNTRAELIDFKATNRLPIDNCLEEYKRHFSPKQRIVKNHSCQANDMFEKTENRTLDNLRGWLESIPSDGYEKWIKVGAWIKSVSLSEDISEEQGLDLFSEWSIQNYIGEKNRRNDLFEIEKTWDELNGGTYGLTKIRNLHFDELAKRLLSESNKTV